MRVMLIAAAAGLAMAGGARAEVVSAQANGFQVRRAVEVAAPAAKVWAALGQIGAWWSPQHTYSGDAKNLTIALRPGACWCEKTADGGVEHMRVVYVAAPKALRAEGALGPLQMLGVTGHLAWTLVEKDGRTTLTQSYDVGGYAPGGLDKLAPVVDQVLGDGLARLKAYVETGKPA